MWLGLMGLSDFHPALVFAQSDTKCTIRTIRRHTNRLRSRSLRFATDLEADVSLTDWTALRVHRVIFDETESQFALLEALQTAADGVDILEFEHRLSSCGFDVDGSVVKLARRAVAGERRALWDLIRYARRLGHDEMGQPQSALEDALAFTRLLGYSNPQQTIAIGLNAAFQRRGATRPTRLSSTF